MGKRVKLIEYLKEHGISRLAIARKLGISLHALSNKLNGESEFKVREVLELEEFLRLDTDETRLLFFDTEVELNSTREA